jgi:arginase
MIQLIGIPYDLNSSFLKGPALAPARIRLMDAEGSSNPFAENGHEIVRGKTYWDNGDLLVSDQEPGIAYRTIKDAITKALQDENPIICLGGDHSISFPIIAAFSGAYRDLHVLHLDAHADLYDNFQNNPYSHASPFARIMENNLVQSLTQVGIRTLNSHQKIQTERFGIKSIEMKHFHVDFLHSLRAPLYISVDVDVLDPAFAPGVSHHEPGGLTTRELIHILQNIPVPIVGADIVEYNPTRDRNNMTAMVAYKLYKELVAAMIG